MSARPSCVAAGCAAPRSVFFSLPIAVRRASRRRHLARRPQGSKRQTATTPRVVLGEDEVLEVRP